VAVAQNVSRQLGVSTYQPLLARMSPGLRGQVTRMTDNGWIERLPYFRNVPESFMVDLVQALHQQAYPPGGQTTTPLRHCSASTFIALYYLTHIFLKHNV
jgi:hypothetical protein